MFLRKMKMEFNLSKNRIVNVLGAAFLSVLVFGLGHVSCGKIKRGIALYVFGGVAQFLAIIILIQPIQPFNIAIAALIFVATYLFVIVDSILIARNPDNSLPVKPLFGYMILVGILILNSTLIQPVVGAVIKKNYVQSYQIPSGAMKPTLLVGDYILVDKHIYQNNSPQRGDVVVFTYPKDPSKDFVKRLIGLKGDVVEMRNKQLYINGHDYSEDYIIHTDPNIIPADQKPRDNFGPITVPENSLFFMGDNRDNAWDSRFWGVVDEKEAKGKVINFYFSRDRETGEIRWKRIGKPVK